MDIGYWLVFGCWIKCIKDGYWISTAQRCAETYARNNFVVPIPGDLVNVVAWFKWKHVWLVTLLTPDFVFLRWDDLVEHRQIHQFLDITRLGSLEDARFQRGDSADAQVERFSDLTGAPAFEHILQDIDLA